MKTYGDLYLYRFRRFRAYLYLDLQSVLLKLSDFIRGRASIIIAKMEKSLHG